jgi:hypothetical protein
MNNCTAYKLVQNLYRGSHKMGGRTDFSQILSATPFYEILSIYTTFSQIHLAGHWTVLLK